MRRLLKNLTFQVLAAIAIGVVLGVASPDTAKAMRPLGDTFINLVKMVIGPIIFLTIVLGIANMSDLKKVGKVGGKALLYFEIVSTFAIALGLLMVNLTKPGAGVNVAALAKGDISTYTKQAESLKMVDFLQHIIPSSPVKAFADGDILQIVFFAILFGVSLTALGTHGKLLTDVLDRISHVFFRMVQIIMIVAPVGAFGAMAYTIGAFGIKSLLPLGWLLVVVYVTMLLFLGIVLNLIARIFRFSLWELIKYIREEILVVFATSSSEVVLPKMIAKLERYGCPKPVVGLVIPAGYSFNLDGTSIYLAMAFMFIAQAYKIDMTIGQQLWLLAILMVTSKGAAGVTGSGFIVLASTLAATHTVPIEGLALLLGVDRFMSTARSITNLIGNGVATIVIAKSEGAFDEAQRVEAVAELHRQRTSGA